MYAALGGDELILKWVLGSTLATTARIQSYNFMIYDNEAMVDKLLSFEEKRMKDR